MCFVEQILFECLLLLGRGKHILVVVLGQDSVSVVVQQQHPFDCIEGRFLEMDFNVYFSRLFIKESIYPLFFRADHQLTKSIPLIVAVYLRNNAFKLEKL